MPAKIKLDASNWGSVTDVQVKTSDTSWGLAKSAWLKTDASTWVRWFLGPIKDSFNRSVSGALGTADTGETWTNVSGTWYANGSAAQSDTAASSNAIATVPYAVNDVTVGASVSNGTGVTAWVVDANNWYALVSFQTQVNTTYACNCYCNGHCDSYTYPVYNSCANCSACGSYVSGGSTSSYAATASSTLTSWSYSYSAVISRSCSSGTLVGTRCYSCNGPYPYYSLSGTNCYSIENYYSYISATSTSSTTSYTCPSGGETGHPGAYSCYTPNYSTTYSCPSGGTLSGTDCVTTNPGTTYCYSCSNSSCGVAYYASGSSCYGGGTYPNCDAYGGGCQTCGTLSNAYYIKLISSVNGTITNLSGDISVTSAVGAVRLNTQGNVFTYQAYSNGDFTGLLTSGTYTETSPSKANSYGIIKTSSPYGQGSTVDNFKISGQDYNMADPFDRPARPWDLFNKNLGRVETEIAEQRFNICLECPQLIKLTSQCKECGCIMNLKTKLPNASCPLGKWDVVEISYKETE